MKKVISILLAVFMLASLAPAALASVETTASHVNECDVYEPFSANGTTVSIAPGFTNAYKTSMTVAPVVRDAETGDYAYQATVTSNPDATAPNYAELRTSIAKTNVAGKKFRFSYDICFDEFSGNSGSTAIALTVKTFNSNNVEFSTINRSVFVGTDEPDLLTVWGYSDTEIKYGTWYHVDHIFNTATGREDAVITGPDGFEKVTGFNKDDYKNIASVSRLDLAMKGSGAFSVDNVSFTVMTPKFEGIQASYASTDDVEFDLVIPQEFTSAIVLCDGKVVTNITSEEGKNCYKVKVSEDDENFIGGSREVTALVTYTDGTTETAKTQIKINGSIQEAIMGSNGTPLSTNVEDFNSLGDYATVTGSSVYGKVSWSIIINNSLWQNTESNIYLIPGASGNAGDYALSLQTINKLIQIDGGKNGAFSKAPITSPDGKLVVEFDAYTFSSNTGVQLAQFGDDKNTADFISGGLIFGQISIPARTWTRIKLVYDPVAGTTSVTANGQTATKNKSLDFSSTSNIRFWLRSGKGFAVDNARTYVLNSDGTETGILLKDETTFMSTAADTFDNLYKYATETNETDTRVYAISYNNIMKTQWMSNNNAKLVYGATGKDNDFAICVDTDTSGDLLQLRALAIPAATTGYFVMNFDLKILSDGVQINTDSISNDSANFLGANKILGLAPIETNVWTNVTLRYDIENSVMYVTTGGKTYSKTTNFSLSKDHIRFTLKAGTGFAIDNAKVYNEIPDASITKAQYVANGADADVSNNAIPANAKALKLTTDSALEVAPSDIELYADGSLVELGAIETSENVITVSLPVLEANTDLKVVLKNSITGLSTDVAQSFVVTDEAGNFIKFEDAVSDNGMVRNIVRHTGASSYKAIAASYNGNKLGVIKTADVVASTAPTATLVNVTIAEADTVKVMLWDSLAGLKPAVENYEVTIAE